EQADVAWIRRFILANGKRHPREMGPTQDTHSPAQRYVVIRQGQNQDRNAVIEASRSAGVPHTIW
ncbi:MAG TPA: hypothetical protein DDZ76_07335, partial [Xanthomonadales bacterium]|nr:hypothetical protein [Xanthomonadales bacterium]